MANSNLQQAISAIKAGDKKIGYQLLKQVITVNPESQEAEIAWLWVSTIISDKQKKIQCVQNTLDINPYNESALLRMGKLQNNLERPSRTQNNDKKHTVVESDLPKWVLDEYQIMAVIEGSLQGEVIITDVKGDVLRKFSRPSATSPISIFSSDGSLVSEITPESKRPSNPKRWDISFPKNNATIEIRYLTLDGRWNTVLKIDKKKAGGWIEKQHLRSKKGSLTSLVFTTFGCFAIAFLPFVWLFTPIFWLLGKIFDFGTMTGGIKGLHLFIIPNKHVNGLNASRIVHHDKHYWVRFNPDAKNDDLVIDDLYFDFLIAYMVWAYYFKPTV